jgi:hypothetical protein
MLAGSARRSGDVYVPLDQDGLPFALDVTATSPISVTAFPRDSTTAAHAPAAVNLWRRLQNAAACARAGLRVNGS